MQTTGAGKQTEECWRGLVSEPAGWLVSTVQLSGTPDSYFYNSNNIITSILPRQEEREKQRNASVSVSGWTSESRWGGRDEREREEPSQESTSEREYEVDA